MDKKIVNVIEEDGEYLIPLGDDLCEQMGWEVGDTLQWTDNKDGSFSLSKQEKQMTQLVLVETVHSFRMRYVVEVPQGQLDWALDTVVCEDAKEFSQEFIGEQIVSSRVLTKEQVIELAREDNKYLASWPDEKLYSHFVTEWENIKK